MAFAEYAQQRLGVPWPTKQDWHILRAKINEFFAHYPDLTYFTLCRVVDWCRAQRKRFDRVWKVIGAFRYAFAAGALPELDPNQLDDDIERRIGAALEVETHPWWRRCLIGAQGPDARRRIIGEWELHRKGADGVH